MIEAEQQVRFDEHGLVPAIVQDARTGEVLTLAYMNAESLRRTSETGETWFWSRSRSELWHKGATSGHTQCVVEMRLDCDGDAIVVRVEPTGAACHTGAGSCFHRALDGGSDGTASGSDRLGRIDGTESGSDRLGRSGSDRHTHRDALYEIDPEPRAHHPARYRSGSSRSHPLSVLCLSRLITLCSNLVLAHTDGVTRTPEDLGGVLDELYRLVDARYRERPAGSYTTYLFDRGIDKILKKVGEEATETIVAAKNGDGVELSKEVSDLLYHLVVMLVDRGVGLDDVRDELVRRRRASEEGAC